MSDQGEVLLSKLANAQIAVGGPVGIWAGGRVTLTTAEIGFEPNGMNRALTGAAGSCHIPLAEIESVGFSRGLVTNIVTVVGRGSSMRFRCYGARAIADRLEQLRGGAAG